MLWKISIVTTVLGVAAAAFASQGGSGPAQSPFYCNLKALTPAERDDHQALTRRVMGAIRSAREIADGYTFEVDAATASIVDLATWTDFERRCCPFFDFLLDQRRENGPLSLRLTGREGVKEFIKAEFPQVIRD